MNFSTTKIWKLPLCLNRNFSLWEKLEVWIYGDFYKNNSTWHIREYALFRKFNNNGITEMNPYLRPRFRREPEYLFHEEVKYMSIDVKYSAELLTRSLTNQQQIMKQISQDQRKLRKEIKSCE